MARTFHADWIAFDGTDPTARPKEGRLVWLWDVRYGGAPKIGQWRSGRFDDWTGGSCGEVTHWAPIVLPEAPHAV